MIHVKDSDLSGVNQPTCSFHTPMATKVEVKFIWMSDH